MTAAAGAGPLRHRAKRGAWVPRSLLRDNRLSYGARGLIANLMDRPPGWVPRTDALARESDVHGKAAIASMLNEAKKYGYYRVERRRTCNGKFTMISIVSDEPVPEWIADHEEFDGKPIDVREQPDGSWVVKHKDGRVEQLDDDFDADPDCPIEDEVPTDAPGGTESKRAASGSPRGGASRKPNSRVSAEPEPDNPDSVHRMRDEPEPGNPATGFTGSGPLGTNKEVLPTKEKREDGNPSGYRGRGLSGPEPSEIQPTLDGQPPAPRKDAAYWADRTKGGFVQPVPKDMVNAVARQLASDWMDRCKADGHEIIDRSNRGGTGVYMGLGNLFRPFLHAGYSVCELRQALLAVRDLDGGLPRSRIMERALRNLRATGTASADLPPRGRGRHAYTGKNWQPDTSGTSEAERSWAAFAETGYAPGENGGQVAAGGGAW